MRCYKESEHIPSVDIDLLKNTKGKFVISDIFVFQENIAFKTKEKNLDQERWQRLKMIAE